MLRYGVIGTSWITDCFVRGAALTDCWRLTAVCSRDAERGAAFAETYGGAAVFTDPAAMAASGTIDAVYIASPNVLHVAQARLFIERGIHVLCEKPLTAHPDRLEALQADAASRGVILLEAMIYMHHPLRPAFRAAAASVGRIGKAHFDFCQYSSKYPAYLRGETPNIFNPAMETGALMDLGVYCLYPAVDLFGTPERVLASANFLRTGADGATAALLDYGTHTVTVTCSKIAQGQGVSEIAGDKGSVTVGSISLLGGMKVTPREGEPTDYGPPVSREELMSCEAKDLYRYITDPAAAEEYAAMSETALAVSRVLYAVRQAADIRFPGE